MEWKDLTTVVNTTNETRGKVVGVTFADGYPDNLLRLFNILDTTGPIQASIRRNPENKYDSNACEVWVDDSMIGHLSKETAAELAPQIDSGSIFDIRIVSIGFANNDVTKPGAGYSIIKL